MIELIMGYYGKLEEKKKAQVLRRKGLSYNEILKHIKVSKDTISRWCRDIILTPGQLERLRNNKKLGGDKGRIIGAKKQQEKRIRETKELFDIGYNRVGKLSERERFIAGISLYIGDGYKSNTTFGFSNSDPKTIAFMSGWLKDFFEFDYNRIKGQLWLHDNLDEKKARDFWAKTVGISEKNIYKTYLAKNKSNSKKIRKNIHKHGIFTLVLPFSRVQREILGLMARVLNN